MSLIEKKNIQEYLPQHPPFLMVDQLESYTEKSAHSRFQILADNVLLHHNQFSEAGLLENMAQTCAVHAGYSFKHHQKNTADNATESNSPVGFIGAIKDFQLFHFPNVNQILETNIVIEHEFGNASVIKGEVHVDGTLVASCEMKIFLQAS